MLTDGNFVTIVTAVEASRRVYDNVAQVHLNTPDLSFGLSAIVGWLTSKLVLVAVQAPGDVQDNRRDVRRWHWGRASLVALLGLALRRMLGMEHRPGRAVFLEPHP